MLIKLSMEFTSHKAPKISAKYDGMRYFSRMLSRKRSKLPQMRCPEDQRAYSLKTPNKNGILHGSDRPKKLQ
jgi:hypothetical protein